MPRREHAEIVLHHAPRTRAFTALWLLEELGVDFAVETFDLASGRHKQPDFLALNPMGKVPVVVDQGVPVSELGAIAIHLADRYRTIPLSPLAGARDRPAFLRWAFFASAIMEPALGEKFFGWKPEASQVAWGSFDQMVHVLESAVDGAPWLLGETFTAADVLVGSTARFAQMFGAFPATGPISAYVGRLTERPAFARASAYEAETSPPPK